MGDQLSLGHWIWDLWRVREGAWRQEYFVITISCWPLYATLSNDDVHWLSYYCRPCGRLWSCCLLNPCGFLSIHIDAHRLYCSRGHFDVVGLYCHLRPSWGPWHVLKLETTWMSVLHAPILYKEHGSYIRNSVDCRHTVKKEGKRKLLWQLLLPPPPPQVTA